METRPVLKFTASTKSAAGSIFALNSRDCKVYFFSGFFSTFFSTLAGVAETTTGVTDFAGAADAEATTGAEEDTAGAGAATADTTGAADTATGALATCSTADVLPEEAAGVIGSLLQQAKKPTSTVAKIVFFIENFLYARDSQYCSRSS